MKKLNNKGFTLVEILAVVVILGMIMAIMIPNISTLINQNNENNIKQLNNSIVSAAKLYISDYKYEISVGGVCSEVATESDTLDITKIVDTDIIDSKIPISILVNEGDLETSDDGNIYNPLNKEEKLNGDISYIVVQYHCVTKNYKYSEPVLYWE